MVHWSWPRNQLKLMLDSVPKIGINFVSKLVKSGVKSCNANVVMTWQKHFINTAWRKIIIFIDKIIIFGTWWRKIFIIVFVALCDGIATWVCTVRRNRYFCELLTGCDPRVAMKTVDEMWNLWDLIGLMNTTIFRFGSGIFKGETYISFYFFWDLNISS